jgi:hypothetical protein
MTSADFLLSYASVTTSLFDHLEHDLLALSSAFIDDDEPDYPILPDAVPWQLPKTLASPLT